MNNESIALAVGHIPSGLFIICAHDQKNKLTDGFLGSWVQQVSFKPLLISICIKPGRPAYDLIKSNGIFSINIIGDHEKNYMKYFYKGYDPKQNPFQEIPHHLANNDTAVVLEDAKSTIFCKMKSSSTPGDHDIIIAEVLGSVENHAKSNPVVHIRKSGLDY